MTCDESHGMIDRAWLGPPFLQSSSLIMLHIYRHKFSINEISSYFFAPLKTQHLLSTWTSWYAHVSLVWCVLNRISSSPVICLTRHSTFFIIIEKEEKFLLLRGRICCGMLSLLSVLSWKQISKKLTPHRI